MKQNAIILDNRTIPGICAAIITTPIILFSMVYVGYEGIRELLARDFHNSGELIFLLMIALFGLGYGVNIDVKYILYYTQKYSLSEDGIHIYRLFRREKVYSWKDLYCVDVANMSVDKKTMPIIRCFWDKPKKNWDSKVRYLERYFMTNDSVCVFSYTDERAAEFEKYTTVNWKVHFK